MAQTKKQRQDRAIEALMECATVTEAAEKSGIPRRTLCTWLSEPEFQRQLRQARSRSFGLAMGRLCRLSNEAVDVLAKGMRREPMPKTMYLSAKSILEFAAQAVAADIEGRLAEIEKRLDQLGVQE